MGKVISLKSGAQLGGCDFKENDEFVMSKGEYIGVLSSNNTKVFRDMLDTLDNEQIEINRLTEEFNEHYEHFIEKINYVLSTRTYVIKSLNPETQSLYIGEDGHMWIVGKANSEVK